MTFNRKKLEEIAKPYDKEAREKAKERREKLRANYKLGYEKGYKDAVEKACKWLKENKDHPLIGCEDPCLSGYLTDEFILDFKKVVEE